MSDNPEQPRPYAHKGDLTNGPIKNHLIRMTVPMIWGLLAVIAVQLADTYFIGLMGDTDILAGISFTFPVTMLISHLVFGINVALSSVVSRLIGAKNMVDTRRVVLHGIALAFILSAVVALATYMSLTPLFELLGADETTLPTIYEYMPIWLAGSVILALPVNANSAMRAAGDTFWPAVTMVIIAVINFILDPLLIFGLFGLPEMGVKGAAVATFIGYGVGMFTALYILVRHKNLIATDGLHLDKLGDSMRRLLVIALPAGLANIINPLTAAITYAVLAEFGNEAVAAFGIAGRVEGMAFLIVIALAIGMAPIVGQNWGAQKFARVHETIDLAILFNLVWSAFIAIVLAVFATSISEAFTDDANVVKYAVMFFWLIPFSYGIGNLVFGWSSAFNAMGKPQNAFIMIFVKSFVMTIPAVIIGGHYYGVVGVFMGIALSNVASGVLFHIISRRQCTKAEEKCGGKVLSQKAA